ncbi:MAG: CBS domain-containing protein, partial [Lentisphaeria bacterium]|nr:CBS domain-containing protein [Lentisphaeria bacterium]
KILNQKNFGALLVLSQEEATVLGIISERDVLRKVEQCRGKVEGIMVKEVMTPRKYMMFADIENSIHDVLEKMNSHKVRHIPMAEHWLDYFQLAMSSELY